MVNVFFVFLILADLVHQELDKVPVVIFGCMGLYYLFVVRKLKITKAEFFYIIFILSMFTSAIFVGFSINIMLYLVLFTLQLGMVSYITFHQMRDFGYLERSMGWVVSWNLLIGVFGILDFVFFQMGVVSPIRDYFHSYKVDSFYASPNIYGVMASFCLIYLLGGVKFFSFKFSDVAKIILLTVSVVLSTSTMAMGLVLLFLMYKLLQNIAFYKLVGVFFVLITSLILLGVYVGVDNMPIQSILNKRLELWVESFNMWSKSPFFGIGTGNFQILNDVEFDGVSTKGEFGLHSLFLWLIVETGIIGFISFFIFVLSVLHASRRHAHRRFAIVVFVLILISQLTEFYLDHEEVFMMLFWMSIVSLTITNNLYSKFPSVSRVDKNKQQE